MNQPVTQQTEVTIKIPLFVVGVLIEGLGEVPTKRGEGWGGFIKDQVDRQIAAMSAPPPAPDAPAPVAVPIDAPAES